jgi:predicted enzyme involved in methoxymalonyl-ACP biosynthesis
MSCRVFGRELEYEAMNIVAQIASQRGVNRIFADFIPSAKNGVVSNLYPGLGFSAVEDDTLPSEIKRWALEVSGYTPKTTHIAHAEKSDA